MAIASTYKLLLDNRFPAIMRKLSDFNFASVKETYNLVKVIEGLEAELKTARAAHTKLFAEFQAAAEAINKLEVAQDEKDQKAKDCEKAFEEKMKELVAIGFTLDERREKIKLSSIETLKLSATEVITLTDLLDFSGFTAVDVADTTPVASSELKLAAPQP